MRNPHTTVDTRMATATSPDAAKAEYMRYKEQHPNTKKTVRDFLEDSSGGAKGKDKAPAKSADDIAYKTDPNTVKALKAVPSDTADLKKAYGLSYNNSAWVIESAMKRIKGSADLDEVFNVLSSAMKKADDDASNASGDKTTMHRQTAKAFQKIMRAISSEMGVVYSKGEIKLKAASLRSAAIRLATQSEGGFRSELLRAITASTNTECFFYLASDGKWYLELESYEEDEDGEQIEGEMTTYGPFSSRENASAYVHRNFTNPGGSHTDLSGRLKPPRNPVKPQSGW